MTWRRAALLALLAFSQVGCRSCNPGAKHEVTRLAKLDGPVAVELEYVEDESALKIECAGGHGIGICLPTRQGSITAVLHVRAPRAFDVAIDAGKLSPTSNVRLAEDEQGTRVALRVGGGAWRVIYLGAGRGVASSLDAGSGDTPAWPAVPRFVDAAPRIFTETPSSIVVDELREQAGDAGVSALLAATLEAPVGEWEKAYGPLPPNERKTVDAALAKVLATKNASRESVRRALAIVDLSGDALREPVLSRLREQAEAGVRIDPIATTALLYAASQASPKEAGTIACSVVANPAVRSAFWTLMWTELPAPPDGEPDDRRWLANTAQAAAMAVAVGEARCPEVVTLLAEGACNMALQCEADGPRDAGTKEDDDAPSEPRAEAPLCSQATLQPELRKERLRRPAETVQSVVKMRSPLRFLLAAGWAQGAALEPIVRQNARRFYRIEQPDSPRCDDKVAPGAPCRCNPWSIHDGACMAGIAREAQYDFCAFTIDDTAKVIRAVRRRSG